MAEGATIYARGVPQWYCGWFPNTIAQPPQWHWGSTALILAHRRVRITTEYYHCHHV